MRLPDPLIRGTLIRRYKRFLADVELESGEVVVAHCANPGSMMGLKDPGLEVWLSHHDDPKRKLKYSWQLCRIGTGLVGMNTSLPNAIAAEAIEAGLVSELAGYENSKREVKYGRNSRIDILLEHGDKPPCYVEIKNVHLLRGDTLAEFPDSVTARGAKHLDELSDRVAAGDRAVMLYVVQRTDCDRFALAEDIDPAYGAAFRRARDAGVEAICYSCDISLKEIRLDRPLPIVGP